MATSQLEFLKGSVPLLIHLSFVHSVEMVVPGIEFGAFGHSHGWGIIVLNQGFLSEGYFLAKFEGRDPEYFMIG